MKIGLIGNMNNNNFALMRYFRDLGVDAHLLLYLHDGTETLDHFTPEADTWSIEKWAPFIHKTKIPNTIIAACPTPISILMSLRSRFLERFKIHETAVFPVFQTDLQAAYNGYDYLIASGITPATLQRINRNLDVFYPYSNEVEFLYAARYENWVASMNGIKRSVFKAAWNKQKIGIQKAAHVVNYEPGITEAALNKIGVNSKRLSIPMVYNREVAPSEAPSEILRFAAGLSASSSFSILHHARQMWKLPSGCEQTAWRGQNKNNHRLIYAFKQLIDLRPWVTPRLFILEYGPDVDDAKKLIAQLNVADYVTWLPKMKRKEIMWLLARVSVVVGEFYDLEKMIWGGTGWEALAYGKPLIQGFNFKEGEFEQIMSHSPPPILSASSSDEILSRLIQLLDSPSESVALGKKNKQWFEKYNGIGLAKGWLSLVETPEGSMQRLNENS
jgi:hypothetical protein